jgi:hypothetical protein
MQQPRVFVGRAVVILPHEVEHTGLLPGTTWRPRRQVRFQTKD